MKDASCCPKAANNLNSETLERNVAGVPKSLQKHEREVLQVVQRQRWCSRFCETLRLMGTITTQEKVLNI